MRMSIPFSARTIGMGIGGETPIGIRSARVALRGSAIEAADHFKNVIAPFRFGGRVIHEEPDGLIDIR